ncbi:MAG TPA: hypothetical protein V6D29_02480 [Leptolyngbyaceae cyanobacterium]
MRVRIELLDVYCHNTEDLTGADALYLVGGVSDGRQSQPVLTHRIEINDGQTRQFDLGDRLIFDAEVPDHPLGYVHIGLTAWDEDTAKQWVNRGEWKQNVAHHIDQQLAQLPRDPHNPPPFGLSPAPDPAKVAFALMQAGINGVKSLPNSQSDDPSGQLTLDIPIGMRGTEIREWRCKGSRFGGVLGSTWDYTIRYRIYQGPPSFPEYPLTYGSVIKLEHCATTRTLCSHAQPYSHPGSSGQRQVTAFEGVSSSAPWGDKTWWVVLGPHGVPDGYRFGAPIQDGDIIRLGNGGFLHSHGGITSPITQQQEVTCFSNNSQGDDNDNWRVELEFGEGQWNYNRRLRLIHVNTNHALHSHFGFAHPQWTMNQQEVTCFAGRDDNDWWMLSAAAAYIN